MLLHNACSATPGGKTTGISRSPDPAEVNSPVVAKESINELHLLDSACSGCLGLITESSFELVSSVTVCFELRWSSCIQPSSMLLLGCAARTAQASTAALMAPIATRLLRLLLLGLSRSA